LCELLLDSSPRLGDVDDAGPEEDDDDEPSLADDSTGGGRGDAGRSLSRETTGPMPGLADESAGRAVGLRKMDLSEGRRSGAPAGDMSELVSDPLPELFPELFPDEWGVVTPEVRAPAVLEAAGKVSAGPPSSPTSDPVPIKDPGVAPTPAPAPTPASAPAPAAAFSPAAGGWRAGTAD
jgi:hypothetical protein